MYMNLKPNKHKIISFNTKTLTSLRFIIAAPLLIKGSGGGGGVGSFEIFC